MALFPQQFIDDIRLQANIVQVIQEYAPLKRAGATYKGLCPFHSEKTPSFHVNPEKGFFHCFGCGVGGDVFKFLELHEKVGFQDAVKMLALKFGVALPEQTASGDDEAGKNAAVREALLKVHEVAAQYFREQLTAPGGARARQQLRDRGVNAKTIEQLGFGFAPASREGLKTRLLNHGFSQGLLVQSGLVSVRDNGEVVDRFRNRLMAPIYRDTGSVIAFGGRAMESDQQPKYLNSPETAIYSKSRTLYGLHLTKAAIRKVGFVVLVEGYFDFAQVFQADAAPVVASCGTALTAHQAQLLRRFTTKVVLSYDPDAAGQGAAARSCELLVKEGFEVNVVVLDKGEDPDSFIRRNGPEQYRGRLRSSRPYLEYLRDRVAAGLDFGDPETQRTFLADMLAVAAWLPEPAMRDQFADKVAHTAHITAEVVQAEFRRIAARRQTTLAPAELPSLGDVKKAEKGLIWWFIHRPAEARDGLATLDQEDLRTLAARRIFEVARSLHGEAESLPSALIQRLSTVDAQLVTTIASEPAPPATSVAECVRAMKRLRCDRERAAIQREIDRLQELGATQHGNEIDNLWQRKKDLLHRIEELT
jgi:DNA primase